MKGSTHQIVTTFLRLLIFSLVTSAVVCAQTLFPMRHLDEVGHLGTEFDSRKSANVGLARVFSDGNGLRFEGRDHGRKPWRVWVENFGGLGFTDVWTADFDHNGQPDLLIAPFFPKNGRCVNSLDIVILLFDGDGRPVPWTIHTEMPHGSGHPYRPVFITDLNGDGNAEIVPVDCEYAMGPGVGTDWTIIGVFEARDARLVPMRNVNIGSYERALKKAYAPHGLEENWLPVQPIKWPDQMSGMDISAQLRLTAMLPAAEQYHGVRVPPIVNGRMVTDWKDPCKEIGHDRAVYSDGQTRRGWPSVIIDGPDGRDIYAFHPEQALRRIIKQKYPVKLLGSDSEPAWVWADAAKPSVASPSPR